MNRTATDTDVLIVGAGPVGLFLANECARRGLRYRIIETKATQSEHSKALAIMPRTLEIFDMAGIVGPFLEVANRVTGIALTAHGHQLAHMRFEPETTAYPFVAMVPQDETERLLVEELGRKRGAVEYETTLVSAAQQADYVVVKLDHKGTAADSTTRFLVGCDGAHSTVRRLLNLSFEGEAYQALFLLADIETNAILPADEMQLCPNECGPLAIFPMSSIRRRVVATTESAQEDAPSLEVVQKALAERGPKGLEARALKWSSYFRIHHRQARQLRVGSIFIAGDAAHIHSPMGGQGMNTGLHDVWNLVWKLDLVLHGHGGEQLLDSYTAERYPAIKSVIETTHFMTQAMATQNKWAQALRDTVIPLVSRVAPFQHALVQRLSQLGVAYRGSPIVEGTGARYFDESIRGGTGICSRFLLLVGKSTSSALDAARQLCAFFREIVELRPSEQDGTMLVRPDGYIAYETNDTSPSAWPRVRSLLERQSL
jgi:2-polyprenyl-6-methoxyphenol hydroxylase-like FAD-dependent oxidoreductase